ncbi:hypothetical protein Hanom_Chr04g00303591 [Helianthus anomalus]
MNITQCSSSIFLEIPELATYISTTWVIFIHMNEYNPSGRYVITYTAVIFIHICYIPKCTRQ